MSDALKPANHGRDHRGGSLHDGIPAEWHNVGDSGEPAFQNGITNQGGGLVPMRFRLLPGDPLDGGDTHGCLEIQGSVTGGSTGDVIFTLPIGYRPSHELRLAASDDSGNFLVLRVLANGEVIWGV